MRTTKRSKFAALVVGLAFIAAACSDDKTTSTTDAPGTTADGDTTPDTEPSGGGGTLIWAHEQEPPDLHLDDPENNLTITSWIRQSMWDGLYGVSAATTFIPELLAGETEMVDNGDGTFSAAFVLRDGLMWSDGEPLTANDVKYTFDMVMATGPDGEDEDTDPDYIYLLGDRTGLDTITSFEVASDTEFTITWSAFFAGWQALFSEVHPAHVFGDDPAAAATAENVALREWNHEGTTLPSSGPLVFSGWERGVNMTLVRNDLYHGSTSPDVTNRGVASVDGVQINFVTDTDAQVNALKAGEAHIIYTQPQLQFEELADSDDFSVASLAGPTFEHWGFNLNNPHLKTAAVREAVALAINKAEVMEALYTPLFGDVLPANGLGNTYWMSNQPQYVDNQGDAGYGAGDIEGAQAALEGAGYVLGDDGIYAHPETGRLSLRVGTTAGNRLREIQEELIQAQLKDAGIEIVINNNAAGASYFADQPFNADHLACAASGGAEGDCNIWDITQFAWVGGPWPGGQTPAYRTGAGNNTYGYANPAFDALADECDATIDNDDRAACYNELDTYVTTLTSDPEGGLFMVPLTQKPSFYAYSKTALASAAVAPDANAAGPLVNVVDFSFN